MTRWSDRRAPATPASTDADRRAPVPRRSGRCRLRRASLTATRCSARRSQARDRARAHGLHSAQDALRQADPHEVTRHGAGERRILRPQQPHPPVLAHAPGLASGGVAEPPEEVGAHGAADRAARVLRQRRGASSGCRRQRIGRRRGTPARRAGSKRGSTAIVRSASSGTPSAPIGPSICASSEPGAGGGTSRKNT